MKREYRKYEYLRFNRYWHNAGYPEEFFHILNEYFSRKMYDLNLSYDKIRNQVNLFLDNVPEIRYYEFDEEDKNVMGYYDEKGISLNKRMINKKSQTSLVGTFFHEAGHSVLDDKKNGIFGMYRILKTKDGEFKINEKDTIFDEIVNELKISRLCSDNRSLDGNITFNSEGYSNMLFLGTALASSLGMSETEFLALTENGRAYFDRVVSRKFANKKEYENLIDEFCYNSSILYNSIDKKEKDMTLEEREINMEQALKSLRTTFMNIQDLRIQKTIASNPNMPSIQIQDWVDREKYNLEKTNINLRKGAYELDIYDRIVTSFNEPEYILKQRLSCIFNISLIHDSASNRLKLMKYIANNYDTSLLLGNLKERTGLLFEHRTMNFNTPKGMAYVEKVLNSETDGKCWEDPELQEYVNDIYKKSAIDGIKQKINNLFFGFSKEQSTEKTVTTRVASDISVNALRESLARACYTQDEIKNNYTKNGAYEDKKREELVDNDKSRKY